jgi:putative hydrolase of the HAD superfamily
MSQTHGTGNTGIKCVFFDMDNTLFDFVHVKMVACQAIIEHIGHGDPDDLLKCFISNDLGFENPENIRHYLKTIDLDPDVLYEECRTLYETKKLEDIPLYPFVKETFYKLRSMGIPVVLVTDAHSTNAALRLKNTGLDRLVDHLITCDMTGAKKPSLTVFQYVLDKFKISPDQALYVGDSLERDIEPAKKIGIIAVHAAYGDRNIGGKRLVVPDHVIGCISEVIPLII